MSEIDKSQCSVRIGTIDELINLWGYRDRELSSTAQFFIEKINTQKAVFYALDYCGECIGELYIFNFLDDIDFADGNKRVYLCAFRVDKEYQHQGLGTFLISSVLEILKGQKINEVTIGVDETEKDNIRLYRRLGFSTKVKDCFVDPCCVDENMQAKPCDCFWLLRKIL